MLSHNGIVWFNNYNLYNFCCPRVTQLFHHPLSNTTFFSCPQGAPEGLVGEGMRTHYLWQYPLVIISCSYMLLHNVIVWFGVVIQCNCLIWCCRTMELFGLAHKGPLSHNVIVWFNNYNLYKFCCPRADPQAPPPLCVGITLSPLHCFSKSRIL